jgi:hypothetical protein
MQTWILAETQGANFGDERLNRRYAVILDRLSSKPSLSIPAACEGWSEAQAAYRFFANEKTTPQKILQPHYDATMERIRAQEIVIIAQDTTEGDLTRAEEKVGGPLNGSKRWGLYVHPLLALTPQRVPLGVVSARLWSRDVEDLEKSAAERRYERRHQPIQAKESYRWLEGYEKACVVAAEAPNTQVIAVSDSEGDIYECLQAGSQEGPRAEWIVRGCQDRALAEEAKTLWEKLACRAVLGQLKIRVSKRAASTGDETKKRKQSRAGRLAQVTVRSARVLLQPPQRVGAQLAPVYVNVVLVREEKPPPGEEPIEWLLLTSLPIETFDEACAVIDYYSCRWEIEVFFRVLKSGCAVEELQFEHADRLEVCLAMYLIVAWRVLYVLMLGRACPRLSCAAVFSEAEWKSAYVIGRKQPVPATPPLLGEMVRWIAELGGYLGRKGDGPPGPQTMWIGLQRTRDFAIAWCAFGPSAKRCV